MADNHLERLRRYRDRLANDSIPDTPSPVARFDREVVNQTQIGKRLGVTPAAVYWWSTHDHTFPVHLRGSKPPVWYWDEIESWKGNRDAFKRSGI